MNVWLIHQGVFDDAIIDQVVKLEQILFQDSWHNQAIVSVLSGFGAGAIVAVQDTVVVGYCIYQVVFEIAEILRIATHPSYQNQGIAQIMLNQFMCLASQKNAQRVLLEVRADNDKAVRLYQRHGFYQIDIKAGYYHGVDALIMQYDIKK